MSRNIYEKFCNYDRDLIVNLMVTTASSYDAYCDDEDTREVIKVLNLGKDFCNVLDLYKNHFYSGDETIVINGQNQGYIENQLLRNT